MGERGTCASWAAQGALQQDTSNKQHFKPCVLSLQGFTSEIISLQFPLYLQLGPKLDSISSATLPPQQGRGTLAMAERSLLAPSPPP